VFWTSTDNAVVSVNNGQVVANGPGTADIVLRSQDGDKEAVCNVIVSSRPTVDGFVRRLVVSERPNTYNIVYLAEGYTEPERGKFDSEIDKVVEYAFSMEPLKTYKEYFNVRSVFVVSEDSGVKDSREADVPQTPFGVFLNSAGVFNASYENLQKGYTYSLLASPKPCSVGFLVNSEKGRSVSNLRIFEDFDDPDRAVFSIKRNTYPVAFISITEPRIALHELGHNFKLVDEYGPYTTPPPNEMVDQFRRGIDASYNVDYRGDPKEVKWKHFIGRKGYERVGVFIGCWSRVNLYRPTSDSIMTGSTLMPNFNAPSREGIVRELFKIAGEEFTLEKFFEKDKPNGY